jgi:nucleotidyltransferase substrate binding protein (TIGR01987 family)
MNINIDSLIKAFTKFKLFKANDKTEQERAGIIKAFEYSFELSWKTMKRFLAERDIIVNSPREVIRMSALEGFIKDPEIWFEFSKKRNLASHSYNEDCSDEVLSVCDVFSEEVSSLIDTLLNLKH